MIRILATAALIVAAPVTGVTAPGPSCQITVPDTVIPRLVGHVTAHNARCFLERIVGQQDKIVGLQVHIQPSDGQKSGKQRYIAKGDEEQFSISTGESLDDDALEMVAPGGEAVWLHGEYVIDGFYVVKSGGRYQGTTSVGLEKVNEADLLLSTKFRVVTLSVQ